MSAAGIFTDMAGLEILGCGARFSIRRGGIVIAGHYSSHGNAVAALRGVERRIATKTRRCMCCGGSFTSTGNRLCEPCKKDAE